MGAKSDAVCSVLHGINPAVPTTGCGNFKPGDINPLGLRVVNFGSSSQEPTPNITFVPHVMEYDLLSKQVVAIVSHYPGAKPAMTPDGSQYIVSLIGFNETTGAVFECPSNTNECLPAATPMAQSITFWCALPPASRFLISLFQLWVSAF